MASEMADFGREQMTFPYGRGLLYSYKDATVVFTSFVEDWGEINDFNNGKRFDKKKLRLIKKDLPLVSFKPYRVNRDNKGCWFFMHKFPLIRAGSKEEWAVSVLRKEGSTVEDVYSYYGRQWKKRGIQKWEEKEKLRDLKRLVHLRF